MPPRARHGLTLALFMWSLAGNLAVAQDEPAAPAGDDEFELLSLQLERNELWDAAHEALRSGNLFEAILSAERVFAKEQRIHKEHEPEPAETLDWLARRYLDAEEFARAAEYFHGAVKIWEKARPPQPWRVADARAARQDVDRVKKMTPEGRQSWARAERAHEIAVTAFRAADDAKTREALATELELRRSVVEGPHPLIAEALNGLSTVYDLLQDRRQAMRFAREALAMRKELYPPDVYPLGHPDLASSLNVMAGALDKQGDLKGARELYEEILAMRRKLYPEHDYPQGHGDIAAALHNLAFIVELQGEYTRALDTYRQALAMLELQYPAQSNPRGHLDIASTHYAIGLNLQLQGRWTEARSELEKALEMQQSLYSSDEFPAGHPKIVSTLNILGALMSSLADYESARNYVSQAIAMARGLLPEETYPRGHPALAACLSNMGSILSSQGDLEGAIPYHSESLAMRRKLYPADEFPDGHPEIIAGLNNAGVLLAKLGKPDDAQPLLEEALAISRRYYPAALFPDGHPELAMRLNNLGGVYDALGDTDRARASYEESLAIARRLFPPGQYPHGAAEIARPLSNLGTLLAKVGELPQAMAAFAETDQYERHSMADVFAASSEKAMRQFLAHQPSHPAVMLSAALKMANNRDAVTQAYEASLARKTVVFDTILRFRQFERLQAGDPAIAQQAEQLRALRQKLADMALGPVNEESDANRSDLARYVNRLEAELNIALAGANAAARDESVATPRIERKLPPDAALVEYVQYKPFDFAVAGAGDEWQEPHYAAFVATGGDNANMSLVDLGPSSPIDERIGKLREIVIGVPRELALQSEADLETHYRELAQDLETLIFAPLRPHLGRATTLLVAPDAELNRVPLESLVDRDGKYLIESYAFAYLSSGADVLRARSTPATGTVIFADPAYRLDGPNAPSDDVVAQLRGFDEAAFQGGLSPELRGLSWQPLPATVEEARSIARLLTPNRDFAPVVTLLGPDALEGALKRMRAPRVLHLATHGFYLPDQPEPPPEAGAAFGQRGGPTTSSRLAGLKRLENPLLRSGFVLAGANRSSTDAPPGGGDGWVTAEEIGLLDLAGTELVVLSACETGLGDLRVGEGVSGLRRALIHAGARTLITSMYKVPDTATQELMTALYTGLAAGKPKHAALREAELSIIAKRRKENGAAHPFYWASFILVGEPD